MSNLASASGARAPSLRPVATGRQERHGGEEIEVEAQALLRWMDARLTAALLAVNPVGLGGAHVRCSPGPVRDQWLGLVAAAAPPDGKLTRLPQHADESRMLGGLDLGATLQAGKPVLQPGLLGELDGGLLLCPMAERLPRLVVAHLTQALDRRLVRVEREGLGVETPTRFGVIALDESQPSGEDPGLEPALAERLAFCVDLHGLDWRSCGIEPLEPSPQACWGEDELQAFGLARQRLMQVSVSDDVMGAMVQAAQALGVESARAAWWAVQAARTLAALRGMAEPSAQEVRDAARLVLGPRATHCPPLPPETADASDCTPPECEHAEPARPLEPDTETPAAHPQVEVDHPADEAPREETGDSLTDRELTVEAIQAALPAGLLALMAQRSGLSRRPGQAREATSRGGQHMKNGSRGRPKASRPGVPRSGQRISLIDTLRQAAPWQRLRKESTADAAGHSAFVKVRREDLRVVRREPRRPTTTVFLVDASGSNALNRLAEAKGAVETMLADCYVRRDRVAVIGFKGLRAEILLPPTRSLVRAKRSLAGLPGGGGTPMARALTDSRLLCQTLERRGDAVSLVLLTDGKANISMDGKPGREQAHADAVVAARELYRCGIACLLIDTSPKPQPQARELALAMGARYVALPYAQAGEIGRIVRNIQAA